MRFIFLLFCPIYGYKQFHYDMPLSRNIKYYQGIHFSSNNLYLGTNMGDIYSINKDEDMIYVNWTKKISNTNIKQIRGIDKYLMVHTAPSIITNTGDTYILDKNSQEMKKKYEWSSMTLFNDITEEYKHIRCDYYGNIYMDNIENYGSSGTVYRPEYPFSIKDDMFVCMDYKDSHIYAITMSGQFTIINVSSNEIFLNKKLQDCHLPTCICVRNYGLRSIFIYIGDVSGNIHFYQYIDKECITRNVYKISNIGITEIKFNDYGLFASCMNGDIYGLEIMTFTPFMHIKTNQDYFKDIDNFVLKNNILCTYNHNKGIHLISL